MIRSARILFTTAAVTIAAACSQTGSSVDVAAEQQAVRDASASWLATAKAKDWGAFGAYFAADGTWYMAGQEPLTGPAATQAAMEAMFASMPNAAVDWTTTQVTVASSGDLAYELGSFAITNDGQDLDKGHYVTVWQKVNGTWKVAADIGVSSTPAPAGM